MNDNTPVYIYDLNLALSKLNEEIENTKINDLDNRIKQIEDYNYTHRFDSSLIYGIANGIKNDTIRHMISLHTQHCGLTNVPTFPDIDLLIDYVKEDLTNFFSHNDYNLDFDDGMEAICSYCESKGVSPFKLSIEDMKGIYDQYIKEQSEIEDIQVESGPGSE